MVEVDIPVDHAHSIINRFRKHTRLKDLAVIDMRLYRRFPSTVESLCWLGRWSNLRGDDSSDTVINLCAPYQRPARLIRIGAAISAQAAYSSRPVCP